ncbi:DNA polymerase/3'-5' exonuclease PolX [Candidatus Peregrinibacteria bacterium]|nr:DNA polymerase/3'-5' exonuclease PolX [Candidatus Peregrinibacteria bacterium]
MINKKIADIFQEIADILEIQDENVFRIRSYQKAALTIGNLASDLEEMHKKNPKSIKEISGIGEDLYNKIVEIIKTGKCEMHQNLLEHFPPGLLDMLRLRGIGPKKVKLLYTNLGVKDLKELEKAAMAGKVRDLPGMGEKSEREILKSIDDVQRYSKRTPLYDAVQDADEIIKYMKENKFVKRIEYAGSLRRRQETIGDIDILVCTSHKDNTPKNIKTIMDHFIKYHYTEKILAHGPTKSSTILESGIQVDLRVLDEKTYGAALHYFTGSKAHNIKIRDMAKKKGLKVNEYGVFKGSKLVGGAKEEDVFKAVGLPYIIPEIRNDDGEIEAALKGELPKSIELKDIRGDLHMHTNETDGALDIDTMVKGMYETGYEYIAITDHSKTSTMVNGLNEKRLLKQMKKIDDLNKKYKGIAGADNREFHILKGSEVDILPDGSLDYSNEILAQMDIFPASVHSRFNMSEAQMTERIIKAMRNPHMKILGHPTGRLINRREPYKVDMEAIIDAAIEYGVALELNSQPYRLDLNDMYLRLAKKKGAKIVINTDAHHTSQLAYMQYGIYIARRGWLEKNDVLNTLPFEKLFNYWKKNGAK